MKFVTISALLFLLFGATASSAQEGRTAAEWQTRLNEIRASYRTELEAVLERAHILSIRKISGMAAEFKRSRQPFQIAVKSRTMPQVWLTQESSTELLESTFRGSLGETGFALASFSQIDGDIHYFIVADNPSGIFSSAGQSLLCADAFDSAIRSIASWGNEIRARIDEAMKADSLTIEELDRFLKTSVVPAQGGDSLCFR